MLRKASIDHCVVIIVCVNYGALEPLLWLITDEALAWLQMAWAEHLSMRSKVRSKGMILPHSVLHEAPSIIHVGENNLSASPSIMSEWGLLNVHDLEPGAHEVLLVKFLGKWGHYITNHLLCSNRGLVD